MDEFKVLMGEATPEEELQVYFARKVDLCRAYKPLDRVYLEGEIAGIKAALEILGIKIEGISDPDEDVSKGGPTQ